MMLIIAIIAVIIVVVIQLLYFFKTRKEIIQLKYIFPDVNNYISIVECSFVPSMLNDQSLKSKMAKLPPKKDEQYNENGEEYFTVSLLKISKEHRREYPILAEIIDKTNVYLCKNHGTSADLEILKDICEEKIATLESSIQNCKSLMYSPKLKLVFTQVLFLKLVEFVEFPEIIILTFCLHHNPPTKIFRAFSWGMKRAQSYIAKVPPRFLDFYENPIL